MTKVFLIGNLTRDPELTETAAGVPVCRFSVAVNRRADGEQTADFYNVTAWRKTAEAIARYTKKGNKIAVYGDLQIRQYEDRSGIRRTSVDVTAQDVEFLTPKPQDDENPAPAQGYSRKSALEAFDDDGDIPFWGGR